MTTMLAEMGLLEQRRERMWNDFISRLTAEERKALFGGTGGEMELFLHDAFVAGEITIRDAAEVISVELGS